MKSPEISSAADKAIADIEKPPTSQPATNGATPQKLKAKEVVRGGAWIYGRIAFTNLLNVLVIAIIARQLTPADFGIVALAVVIMKLVTVLGTEGVNQFIVYDNREGREDRTHAVFWLDLSMSSVCAVIGILCIPFITEFYQTAALGPILVVLLIAVPINSLSKVPDALLRKTFRLKALELRESVIAIIAGAAGIVMAIAGAGAWSLVLPGVAGAILRVLIVYRITPWRPRWNFHFEHWRTIFAFHSNIMGSATTSFIISEGDTLLVGKILGSAALGIYNLAWQAANFVNRSIVNVANRLALPTLSALHGGKPEMARVIERMLRILSAITFPMLIGLFVVADDFVLLLYGPQWEAAVTPLRILIIYALRYAVSSPTAAFFQAVGRPDINFKLGLSTVPFYIAAIWLGSRFGIVGVAWAVTAVRTIFGFIAFAVAARFLGNGFLRILAQLAPAFCAATIMGGVVFVAKPYVHTLLPGRHVVELVLLAVLGAATYVFLLRYWFRQIADELSKLTAPLLGQKQVLVLRLLNVK